MRRSFIYFNVLQSRGWTAAPMFVLICNGRIFRGKLAKPNSLDDINKSQNEQILALASWILYFCKIVYIEVTRFLGKSLRFARRSLHWKSKQFPEWIFTPMGVLLHYSFGRGSYYSGGRTNRGGRSNRGSTVFMLSI